MRQCSSWVVLQMAIRCHCPLGWTLSLLPMAINVTIAYHLLHYVLGSVFPWSVLCLLMSARTAHLILHESHCLASQCSFLTPLIQFLVFRGQFPSLLSWENSSMDLVRVTCLNCSLFLSTKYLSCCLGCTTVIKTCTMYLFNSFSILTISLQRA